MTMRTNAGARPGPFGLYARFVATSFRAQLQYPVSFVLQTIGHLFGTGVEFIGIWAMFARFGSIAGWTFGEAAVLYGVVNIAFAFTEAVMRGFDMFGRFVRSGEFDRMLLRPRGTILQVLGHEVTLRRAGRLVQAGIAISVGLSTGTVELGAAGVVLLVLAVPSTSCVFAGLLILQATLSFKTVETLEVMNIVTYGGVETAQYPLSIYPRIMRRFFTFVVPLGLSVYAPVLTAFGRADATTVAVAWAGLLAGPGFLALAIVVWNRAVRSYTSVGS